MARLVIAVLVVGIASQVASAQCACATAAASTTGGPLLKFLGKLNQPLVPGVSGISGMPTLSPLGLIAPRLSYLTTFATNGAFGNLSANLPTVTGIAVPRLAPVVGLAQGWPPTPQRVFKTGLGVVSPRVATGVQVVQAYQTAAQTGQAQLGAARGGAGLLGRRCR